MIQNQLDTFLICTHRNICYKIVEVQLMQEKCNVTTPCCANCPQIPILCKLSSKCAQSALRRVRSQNVGQASTSAECQLQSTQCIARLHSGPLQCIGIGCSSASSHFAARNKSRADNWRSSQQQRLGGKRGRGKEFKGCYELCVYWKGADIYCRLDKTRIIWPDLGIRQFELGSRRVSMRSGSKTRQAQLAYFIPLRTQEDRTDKNRQISLFVGQHVDTSKIYCLTLSRDVGALRKSSEYICSECLSLICIVWVA